ncbi:MAG: serine hydrolase domain-containing protein [Longimicrobiales bacterium]
MSWLTGLRRLLWLAPLILCACSDAAGPNRAEPIDVAAPWVTSSASAQGFNENALNAAYARAATVENIRALVVLRNGRMVREAYFNGATTDSAFDLRSVTKTVMALIVGLASERGLLTVDDPIARWLPADLLRPEQQAIRIRHMLTMTSGIQWSDQANFNPGALSGRPVAYVLELPVVATPGSRFIYNSGGSHLLPRWWGARPGRARLRSERNTCSRHCAL